MMISQVVVDPERDHHSELSHIKGSSDIHLVSNEHSAGEGKAHPKPELQRKRVNKARARTTNMLPPDVDSQQPRHSESAMSEVPSRKSPQSQKRAKRFKDCTGKEKDFGPPLNRVLTF